MKLFVFLIFFFSLKVFAIPCDCEVRVFSPLTGPHSLGVKTIVVFQLEEYSNHSLKNQKKCSNSCIGIYEKEMTNKRLNFELLGYSQELVRNELIGYNCTGLTTLKFPVRVRASLGDLGLGNVADFIHVINMEQFCLN